VDQQIIDTYNSCSFKHKPVVNQYTSSERDSVKSFLEGEWLEKTYYDELVKTKSPLKALKNSTSYEYILFFTDRKDDNVLGIIMLDGFHLSNYGQLVIEKMNKEHTFFFDNNGSGVTIIGNGELKYQNISYIKCTPLESVLNSIIIAGTYVNQSDSTIGKVKFNVDGTFEGFGEKTTYEINTDPFTGDSDIIIMGNGNDYAFEVSKNCLYLYEAKDLENSPSLIKGKLVCKLTKER